MAFRTIDGQEFSLLMKLGELEHLLKLRKGEIYMKTLSYFEKVENDLARGDKYEGTDHIIQPQHFEMTLNSNIAGMLPFHLSPEQSARELTAPVRISLAKTRACNLFCMFAVNEPIEKPIFSPEHKWPGDHFVLITNTEIFLQRFILAAQAADKKVQAKLVEYYDGTIHSGDTGRFRKRSIFKHQRECRLAIEPETSDHIILQAGDLQDVTSEVIALRDAYDMLDFTSKSAREGGLTWQRIEKEIYE